MAKAASAKPRSAQAERSIRCLSRYERQAYSEGFTCIAGVDEVGRGSLFGPVFAAAVVLDPERPVGGLRDSKILDAEQRNGLAQRIKRRCLGWAVGAADVYEVDQINILQASRVAMRRAVEKLIPTPDYLLIDAVSIDLPLAQLSLIDGDARCQAIAAASIIAKVHRDACLDEWDRVFPQYRLKSNKGYSTPDHRKALREHGPTALHRFSFEPVRNSASLTFWSGYTGTPLQVELFSDETLSGQTLGNRS